MKSGTLILVSEGQSVGLGHKARRLAVMMGHAIRDVKLNAAYCSRNSASLQLLEELLNASRQHNVPYEQHHGLDEPGSDLYLDQVLPQLLAGKNILLVASGDTTKSLLDFLESTDSLEAAFGTVFLYQVNQKGRSINKKERHIQTSSSPA